MGIFKTLLLVGTSAAIGSYAGGKAFDAVAKKLPGQLQESEAARVGFQAGIGVVAFSVLRSVF